MDITKPDHPLFKVLKGHILHCTSAAAYRLICKDGYIRANDNSFPYTWEQTKGSCVHQLGGISLLYFGLPEDKVFFVKDQEDFRYPWESILVAHTPITVIVKINRDKILNKIITWEEINEKTKKCLLIPYTEVCTLEPISISLFEGIVVVKSFSMFNEISEGFCSKDILDNFKDV